MSDNIEVARLKISGYGERYAGIMLAALNTKSQSELRGPLRPGMGRVIIKSICSQLTILAPSPLEMRGRAGNCAAN
jgi:hypothetical protein